MKRLAVIGAGGWGRNHVRVFSDLLGPQHVVVCDTDPKRLAAAEKAHPGVQTCTTLDYGRVDAAVVATPAPSHYRIARAALEENLHVLVEKPITLRSAEAEELVGLAAKRGRVLMVDHLLEYHPAVLRLREWIDDGVLGRVLHITSRRLNLGVVRTEENALWSLAPHDISVLLFLIGEEPQIVAAHGGAFLQPGIEDVAMVALGFASGAVGYIHSSWLDPEKTRTLTVVGDHAMAVFDDGAAASLTLYEHRVAREGERFIVERTAPQPSNLPPGEPLQSVAKAFLESVETGRRPRADGEDGLRVVRVLERADRALKMGGKKQ